MTNMNEQRRVSSENDESGSIRAGSAAFLVKGPEVAGQDSPFLTWLQERGYSSWKYSKGYTDITWVWVNLSSKNYARGIPGIRLTREIGDHAITVEEFKMILAFFDKYTGKERLDMG